MQQAQNFEFARSKLFSKLFFLFLQDENANRIRVWGSRPGDRPMYQQPAAG